MNKITALAITTILGNTSIAYAAEVPDIIKKLGLEEYYANGGPPPETGSEGDVPEEIQALWVMPSEINWVNDDPVYNMQLCEVDPVKMDETEIDPDRHMGDFEVTACGDGIPTDPAANPPGCQTVLFKYPGSLGHPDGNNADPSEPWGGGEADGTGWNLTQWGRETWNMPWTIELGPDVKLDSIEIDLLSKTGPIKAGFDILLRPNDGHDPETFQDSKGVIHTDYDHPSPGSGAGWPVEQAAPFGPEVGPLTIYTATFYNPIVLTTGRPLQDPHDLYGKVKIEFLNGLEHDTALSEFAFSFWQDTDCLPVDDFDLVETDKENGTATFTAAGIDMNLYVLRVSETGAVEEVLNDGLPFIVSLEEGETTITETVEGLQEGALYEVVDVSPDDGSTNVVFGPKRF